jgi:hypothetical protein
MALEEPASEILMSIEPDMFVKVFAEWNHRLQSWINHGGGCLYTDSFYGFSLDFRELAFRRTDFVHLPYNEILAAIQLMMVYGISSPLDRRWPKIDRTDGFRKATGDQ